MSQKTVIKELKHLMKDENPFYIDKETQMVDYQTKAVTIVGGSEDNEFLMGLLYELYSGQLYGDRFLVRVYLLDSKSNLEMAEFAYTSIWTSGLPFFDDFILTSDPKRALKKAEYVIIHPNIKWDTDVTREEIIKDNFIFFKTLAEQICEHCIPTVQILLIGTRCMIPFRLILTLFLNKFGLSQIHALTRTVERAAASLISHKIECNSNEVRGVAVFGEDIVEVKNAWLEWGPQCDADLIDLTTIKYGDPELGQWMEKKEELREAMARLELPKGVEVIGLDPLSSNLDDGVDLPPLAVPKIDVDSMLWAGSSEKFLPRREEEEGGFEEIDVEMRSNQTEEHQATEEIDDKLYTELTPERSDNRQTGQKRKKVDWQEWMKERFPEVDSETKERRARDTFWADFYLQGRTSATQFRESSKPWQCPLESKPLVVPEDSEKQYPVYKLCSDWRQRVATVIKDENFLKGTIFKKCRHWLTGYAQAKGVINYIRKVLQSKKNVYTNEVVCSPGAYGIPEGLYSSFPVCVDPNGHCKIIQGYQLSQITLLRIRRMVKEVLIDYETVFDLFNSHPPEDVKEISLIKYEHEQLPEEPMEAVQELHDELKEEAEEEIQD